jgi:hypothetical protein
VLVGAKRRSIRARDQRGAAGVRARVDGELANLDELAVLCAPDVARLGAVRKRGQLAERVDRDRQARESALDPHATMMHDV